MQIFLEGNKEDQLELLRLKPIFQAGFKTLQEQYPSLSLPERFNVRFMKRINKPCNSMTMAYCCNMPDYKYWYIALHRSVSNMTLENQQQIIFHEIAHAGEALSQQTWGHGAVFHEIKSRLNQSGTIEIGEALFSFVVWFWIIYGTIKFLKHLV